MSKLEERESRRRSATVGKFVEQPPMAATSSGRRGRPKEDRELKKRISLSVLPSVYEDIQKIAYVQRRSVSELIGELLEGYRVEHKAEIQRYGEIGKALCLNIYNYVFKMSVLLRDGLVDYLS